MEMFFKKLFYLFEPIFLAIEVLIVGINNIIFNSERINIDFVYQKIKPNKKNIDKEKFGKLMNRITK